MSAGVLVILLSAAILRLRENHCTRRSTWLVAIAWIRIHQLQCYYFRSQGEPTIVFVTTEEDFHLNQDLIEKKIREFAFEFKVALQHCTFPQCDRI